MRNLFYGLHVMLLFFLIWQMSLLKKSDKTLLCRITGTFSEISRRDLYLNFEKPKNSSKIPILSCLLVFKHPLIKSATSSFVKGSPNISSLVVEYLGPPDPARKGPGDWTGFTPFFPWGGSLNESNSGSFFLLGGSGARPVQGLGVSFGPNGRNGGSLSATGFTCYLEKVYVKVLQKAKIPVSFVEVTLTIAN